MTNIPFKAAIFDLDGTLLDSMYVWMRVDELFFAQRGMTVPEGYSRAIAGLSYRETAEYTVAHYLPDDTPEGLIAEWTRLSAEEYAQHVPLKKGALSYLRMLRREGVKLGIATALTPELYTPCLERLNLLNLFDAICSTEHCGGRGKCGGEVFRLAARQLGVAPEDCAVFEDVPAGLQGAKAAGMRAYGVRDAHSSGDFPRMERLADAMLDSMDDMRAVHAFAPRRRCVIFTAYAEGGLDGVYTPRADDLVLCADGGWKLARALGVTPDLVIGDFDSAEPPASGAVETHPVLKDDTDTLLCIRRALALGYDDILLLGGLGGRLDHTLSNLQCMGFAARHGADITLMDGRTTVFAVYDGEKRIPRREGKLSFLALDSVCRGICLRGTRWPLTEATLTNTFPIGCSNEFAAEEAVVSVREGVLLGMLCHD